ncbi:MAG: tetratricopeptide repeat-containing sensor histidine kinase [Bacteroidetes bacterium]|nr:tetratricopeptide repeat-containing sensor histidine kinase [Bacteroidota bacterium]
MLETPEEEIGRLLGEANRLHTRNPGEGLRLARRGYHHALLLQDTMLMVRALNMIGVTHWIHGVYDSAVEIQHTGLMLAEAVSDPASIARSANNLGLTYRNLGMSDLAETYFRACIRIRELLPDTAALARSIMNMGLLFAETDRVDSALIMHERSLALARSVGDTLGIARNLHYIGRIGVQRGSTTEALIPMQEAYRLFRAIGDINGYTLAGADIARLLHSLGRHVEARRLGEQALASALDLESRFAIREAADVLASIHAALGNYRRAHDFQLLYRDTNDSLRSESILRNVARVEIERELAIREREIRYAERQREFSMQAELQSEVMVRNSLIGGSVLLTLLLVSLLFAYRGKQKANTLITGQHARIEEVNRELEQLVETRERLFGIIGHDLRAPVGNVASMLDLAADTSSVSPEDREELTESARVSAHASSLLLNRLLDWARAQRGQIMINPEAGNLCETARAVMELLDPLAKAKSIELDFSCPDTLSCTYDAHLVIVILENLLSNAIKFTPERGRVTLELWRENEYVQLRVSDTGVGISATRLQAIRRRAPVLPGYGTSREGGHGLGLDLCHRFVDLQGGTMTVESEEGRGTAFTVSLPLCGSKDSASGA